MAQRAESAADVTRLAVAISHINGTAGRHGLQPNPATALVNLMGLFPIGTLVKLNHRHARRKARDTIARQYVGS